LKKNKNSKKKKPKKYVRVFAPFLASFLKNLKLKKCIYYFSDLFVIVEWRRPILKLEIISPSNPFFLSNDPQLILFNLRVNFLSIPSKLSNKW
jgi:hypothetical protein